jgi:hypothetical protein
MNIMMWCDKNSKEVLLFGWETSSGEAEPVENFSGG